MEDDLKNYVISMYLNVLKLNAIYSNIILTQSITEDHLKETEDFKQVSLITEEIKEELENILAEFIEIRKSLTEQQKHDFGLEFTKQYYAYLNTLLGE